MEVRPFDSSDAEQLLIVFRKSVPAAFGANEVDEYAEFLRTNTDPYFVATYQEKAVGTCGYYIDKEKKTARICWILTDPDLKGMSIGSTLLKYTLLIIRQQAASARVECRTSQVAFRFFEKFGCQLQYTAL